MSPIYYYYSGRAHKRRGGGDLSSNHLHRERELRDKDWSVSGAVREISPRPPITSIKLCLFAVRWQSRQKPAAPRPPSDDARRSDRLPFLCTPDDYSFDSCILCAPLVTRLRRIPP